jgi:hypothetical protein
MDLTALPASTASPGHTQPASNAPARIVQRQTVAAPATVSIPVGRGWQATAMDRRDALQIKYARAQEHHAAWSRALDKWVATMPYAVRGEADPLGVVRGPARGSGTSAAGAVGHLRGHDL